MSIVTVSLAATTGFREVITEDSFSMLNIIPSSPGREEVPDGGWGEVGFSFEDGVVRIPCEWPCYGVKVLRIRR